MRLDEAKVILEENGYELIEEGFISDIFSKLAKKIGIVALSMGLITSANAYVFDLNGNFGEGKQYETEQELKADFVEHATNRGVNCKIKKHGVICKFSPTDKQVTFINTSKVKGFSSNTDNIDFDLNVYHEENNSHSNYMRVSKSDGTITTFMAFDNGKVIKSVEDDMGVTTDKKMYFDKDMYNKIIKLYKNAMESE